MILMGAIVDGLASLFGGLMGWTLKQRVSRKLGDFLMVAVALCIICAGIQGVVHGSNLLLTTLEMVVGSAVGYALNIERAIQRLGDKIQDRLYAQFQGKDSLGNVAEGFITATLIVCVGSLGIVGSMNAGLKADNSMLFAKALMDLVICMLLATTLGVGVSLCGFVVVLYEGILTLVAAQLSIVLTEACIIEMMVVGSLLLFALGLDMMGIKKMAVANMLPACFMPIIFVPLFAFLGL